MLRRVRNTCLLAAGALFMMAGKCETDDPVHYVPFEEWCMQQTNWVLTVVDLGGGAQLLICEFDGDPINVPIHV
ncbi:MAG: hypothetical protein F4139_08535 [Gemmatimonadetes bacterium]|nr:hypothetical protein [Gemmatimonadota bacterium]MYA63857.1 hypothetical protein [Gemmatimonadota bacterium]MYB97571.1 hypothetical protein [Gemmatimonadota bacterium]MYH52983.1 hypothetical protein [Gemmatimonadota bacterium]MYI46469.1 hypothetical protein [Gemmatimonadota bacterium]